MKNIIFFHGEKGGVGKSTALIMCAEYMMSNGISISVIEADRLTDVGQRYEAHGIVCFAPLELSGDRGDAGINRVFEAIMDCENDIVLVNLPGAASAKIEPSAEIIKESFADFEGGAKMSVVFVADSQDHSRKFYDESFTNGLMRYADKTALVANLQLGKNPNTWSISSSKFKSGVNVVMDELEENISSIIKNAYLDLHSIMSQDLLNAFQKAKLRRWIKSAEPLVNYIIE